MEPLPHRLRDYFICTYLPNRGDRARCARVSKAWNRAMQPHVPGISALCAPPGCNIEHLKKYVYPVSDSITRKLKQAHKHGELEEALIWIHSCLNSREGIRRFNKLWGWDWPRCGDVAKVVRDMDYPPAPFVPFFGGFWLTTEDDETFFRLLKEGANPNTRCKHHDGRNEFVICRSARGNNQRLKALLDAGANPKVKDAFGHSLIRVALFNKNLDEALEATLMILDADPTLIDCLVYSKTPLCHSISLKNEKLAAALIERGASVDKIHNGREIPLMLAVQEGLTDIVRRLLDKGADPISPRDHDGQTLLELAQGNPEITAMLQEAIDQRRAPEENAPAIAAEVPMDEPQAPPPGHAHPVPIDEPVVQAEAPAARPFEHLELACLLAIGTYALWRGLRLRART